MPDEQMTAEVADTGSMGAESSPASGAAPAAESHNDQPPSLREFADSYRDGRQQGNTADEAAPEQREAALETPEEAPVRRGEKALREQLGKVTAERDAEQKRLAPYQKIFERPADSLERALALTDGLYSPVYRDGVPQYDDATNTPLVTAAPFVEALLKDDPVTMERLLTEVLDRPHHNGKGTYRDRLLESLELNPERLQDYRQIDKYMAEYTVRVSETELEDIPEGHHDWWKANAEKLPQKIRDTILTEYNKTEQEKLIQREIGSMELLDGVATTKQEAANKAKTEEAEWHQQTVAKADERAEQWGNAFMEATGKAIDGSLERAADAAVQGVVFSPDPVRQKAGVAQTLSDAYSFVIGPQTYQEKLRLEALQAAGIEEPVDLKNVTSEVLRAHRLITQHERNAELAVKHGRPGDAQSERFQAERLKVGVAVLEMRSRALADEFVMQLAQFNAGNAVQKAKARNAKQDTRPAPRPSANNGQPAGNDQPFGNLRQFADSFAQSQRTGRNG